MTKEQVIQGYLMNSPKVVAEMLYDTIEKYENRSCESCKHYDGTQTCNNFIARSTYSYKDFSCNKWKSK